MPIGYSFFDIYYEDFNKQQGGSTVQSVLVPRSKYTLAEAKRWVRQHGYKISKPPDVTEKYYRFRQTDPKQYSRMRTVDAGSSGVRLIVGFK
jgi:hypothetical protein